MSTTFRMRGRVAVLVIVSALAMLAVSGCSSAAAPSAPAAKPAASPAVQSSNVSLASNDATQVCVECSKKGMPKQVVGAATVQGTTQVINISLAGGSYVPNKITAKAGLPIQVVFAGKAKGCLGMPKFSSLNKKADFTMSGTATIDLGTLKPGVYKFTCGMGMNAGTITVQ